jgi:hypothetical protein
MAVAETAYDQWIACNEGAARYDKKLAGSHWVIHYPLGTSLVGGVETDNFTIAQTIISRLESSGAIAVPRTLAEFTADLNAQTPDAWKIELINDSGGQTAFNDRMKYLDALKARAFGMPERTVFEGQFGTKAEAEAHADLAIVFMEMRHSIICQQINQHVVNQLLRTNFGPDAEDSVYIQPAPIADLEKSYLQKLYDTILADPNGLMTEIGGIDMESLRDRLGIPVLPALNVDTYGNFTDVAGTPIDVNVTVNEYGEPAYYEEPVFDEGQEYEYYDEPMSSSYVEEPLE